MKEREHLRRKHFRVVKPIPILVFWQSGSERFEADLYDLSASGCFLNTRQSLNNGELLTIEIPNPLDSKNILKIAGTNVEQNRKLKGFGVKFTNLSDKQQKAIDSLLANGNKIDDRRKI